jgi:hypothetical protein
MPECISLPPINIPKPASGIIRQGAISLPRRRTESQEKNRNRGASREDNSPKDSKEMTADQNIKV